MPGRLGRCFFYCLHESVLGLYSFLDGAGDRFYNAGAIILTLSLSVDGCVIPVPDSAIGGIILEILVKRQQEVTIFINGTVQFLIIAVIVPDV